MKNNDAFGCTTFRKGNHLGRSYDFYCNDVASSVLHTSRIEGVRYESIGMSGSSFNGMKKDKAIDGTIDKAIMDTLFSSIVDGINENGVAISTLVVPRGDKGITTGTNPIRPSVPARLVSRVVLDKAYSAKNAIKILSEVNIVQNWGAEYELHWMIADASDTYIVETVDNELSYRGPSSVTLGNAIISGYNGQLEADVVTNFYISGFKSSFANTYITTQNWGKETRVYEVPQPYDADGGYYEYADGGDVEVRSGEYVKAWGTDHGVIDDVLEDDKYYIVTTKHEDGTWTFSGVTLEVRENEPLYHADGTLVDMPLLGEFVEGVSDGYNTFEMPITNPTVTNYGAGLERFQLIKDAIKDATLSSDEEAMEIINLVQYTNAYKNNTAWYTEFVNHSLCIDNRTPLTAIKNTGKLGARLDSKYQPDGTRYYYEIIPPTDESFISTWGGERAIYISSESLEGTYMALKGSYWLTPLGNWSAPDPDKWYVEINGTGYEDVSDIHYVSGERVGTLIRGTTTSDYVDYVNLIKEKYAEIWNDGGKEAVREYDGGASWHSNHQCVYDLANKKMLVYPSENGEYAYRVNIHGEVENEAVELNED